MNTRKTSKRTANDAELSNLDFPTAFEPDSATRVWQWLDKKMSKQTESLNEQVSQFCTLLREGEERLMEKIKTTIKEAENRLLNEIDKRFCELREELDEVNERVSKLETVSAETVDMKEELRKIKIQSLKHSNSIVACDLRINAVPFSVDEDLHSMFNTVCRTLEIPKPPVQFIHRLQNKNNKSKENSPDGVIIVRLMTPYDKNFVLKSLNNYKKEHPNLLLSILGFEPNEQHKFFYIHENLTNGNYKLLREAVTLKKQNVIKSAYSFRGLVYVKRSSTDKPTCIESLDALNSLFRHND